MISYTPIEPFGSRRFEEWQKEHIRMLNKALGVNIEFTKEEEQSLQWLAGNSTETVINIASAIEKTASRTISPDDVIVKRTSVSYCSCCLKDFYENELVYYVVIDNNMICTECKNKTETKVELRVYKE